MSKSNGVEAAYGSSLELPLAELPKAHPCNECGKCCEYIAIEIDNPSSFKDYDNIYWYLTHKSVCVYIDWEGCWFIEFSTPCEHLTQRKTCGVYEQRPKICSDFSWNECEVTTAESAWKYRFDTYEELVSWMQKKRPRAWENYAEMRKKLVAKRRSSGRRVLRKSRSAGARPWTATATQLR